MNGQLNGWFGRFIKKAISKIAEFVDSALNTASYGISSEIGSFEDWANDIGNGGASFWNRTIYPNNINQPTIWENDPRGNYEPTFSEESILDIFAIDFGKLIANIVIETNSFDSLTKEQKVQKLNEIMERVSIIKKYFQTNYTKGLSFQAVELRNLIVEVMFDKIIQFVESKAFELGLFKTSKNITIQRNTELALYALKPLDRKVLVDFNVEIIGFSTSKTSSSNTTVTDPVKPDLPNGSTTVVNPKPDNTGTKPTETMPSTPGETTTTGNKTGLKIFGLFIAGVVTAKIFSK